MSERQQIIREIGQAIVDRILASPSNSTSAGFGEPEITAIVREVLDSALSEETVNPDEENDE